MARSIFGGFSETVVTILAVVFALMLLAALYAATFIFEDRK